MHAYADVPEAIEYGENFIVHREGPEATPYLPNVIVSSNPLVRPEDYGIPANSEHWDERTIRNIKMPWSKVKQTKNFLWEKGFQFYCLTPKTRHRVHSGWSNVDWHMLMDSNFGDPYRLDKRAPCVGEHQMHMNPQAARDLNINDGDYVYVDANPADRPYFGAKPDDPFYRVSRLMLRVTYNRAYPYNIVMMKHAPFIATEKSVKAHETRPDGRALSENTGYQANLRYGSQQSVTRNWHMPMHQTDTLFHKTKAFMGFHLRRRGRQSRRQHGAERNPGAHHQSRRRRYGRQRHLETGDDRLLAGQRERVDETLPGGRFNQSESVNEHVQAVQIVQAVQPPPVSSPASAGEEGIGGSNAESLGKRLNGAKRLNVLNDLNTSNDRSERCPLKIPTPPIRTCSSVCCCRQTPKRRVTWLMCSPKNSRASATTREQLLWLFKNPFYGGAHGAYRALGETRDATRSSMNVSRFGESIRITVQDVQTVQPLRSFKPPPLFLPRSQGRMERTGGLNRFDERSLNSEGSKERDDE